MSLDEDERKFFEEQYFSEIPLYKSVVEVAKHLAEIQAKPFPFPKHLFEDDLMCGLVLMLAEGSPDEAQIIEIVKRHYFADKWPK